MTWSPGEIDNLWHTINSSQSKPFSYWISLASLIFAVLGTVSNLLSMIVLMKLSTQLSTFVYLTSLSLSDMITCLMMTIKEIVEFLVQTRLNTSISIGLHQLGIIVGALAAGSRVLSLWISIAVTLDRWILICYPTYGKTFCTLKISKILSGTLFFIAFVYSIPLFFEYEIVVMPSVYQMLYRENESNTWIDDQSHTNSILVTKGYSDLARRRLFRWTYMFFNVIFVYTLPTLTIVLLNVQLIRALHRLKSRSKRLKRTHGRIPADKSVRRRHSSHSKYSVTNMVIAMVLALLLCRSPTVLLWILWSFELTIKKFFDSSSSSIVRSFQDIANLIAIINAATNFIPFCVFGQLFRNECLRSYCRRKPTSEQLASQAKRKYKEDYHPLNGLSRTPTISQQQRPTMTVGKVYLHAIPSNYSDSNSGITPSPNHSSFDYQTTNILRLSDPPLTAGSNGQTPSRLSVTGKYPSNETVGL